MAFWSDTALGIPDPKRKYRFLVFAGGIAPWVAKKVTKPGWEISESKHTYLVHQFYYPGRITWKDVTLTLVDPSGAGTDTMQTIYNNLVMSGFVEPTSPSNYTTISKATAVDALGTVKIQQIADDIPSVPSVQGMTTSAGTKVIEEWVLYNAWIKDVDLGDLDYEADELNELSLTLRYDYALLNSANPAHSSGVPTPLDGFPNSSGGSLL